MALSDRPQRAQFLLVVLARGNQGADGFAQLGQFLFDPLESGCLAVQFGRHGQQLLRQDMPPQFFAEFRMFFDSSEKRSQLFDRHRCFALLPGGALT